jgi:hypothetical protein
VAWITVNGGRLHALAGPEYLHGIRLNIAGKEVAFPCFTTAVGDGQIR